MNRVEGEVSSLTPLWIAEQYPRNDQMVSNSPSRKSDACAHAFERLAVGIPPNHFLNLRIRGSRATKTHTSLAQQ
ncbi:hypothetical protein BJF85_17940 [Saccharomonospora sp. CUA-673]|nr:hypothetical protein BJF85_17940 [Saccharomonospora sp. CUA-673]